MIHDDPMHIDNVRARQAADSAERAMYQDIAREVDGPTVTPVGMLCRALARTRETSNTAKQPSAVDHG